MRMTLNEAQPRIAVMEKKKKTAKVTAPLESRSVSSQRHKIAIWGKPMRTYSLYVRYYLYIRSRLFDIPVDT